VEQTVSFMDERIKFYEPFMAKRKGKKYSKQEGENEMENKRNEIKETHNSKVAKGKEQKTSKRNNNAMTTELETHSEMETESESES